MNLTFFVVVFFYRFYLNYPPNAINIYKTFHGPLTFKALNVSTVTINVAGFLINIET